MNKQHDKVGDYPMVAQAVQHAAFERAPRRGVDPWVAKRMAEIEERLSALGPEEQAIFIERAMEGCEGEWDPQLVDDYKWIGNIA